MKKQLLALLIGFASILLCAGNAPAQASVTTDHPDYPPGSTVYISGTGFQAGETVQVQVLRTDIDENAGAEHDPWQVTADASGNFQTTWFVTSDEAGATLQLTATGLTSGLVAQTTFTDSATVTTAPSLNMSADTAATGGTGAYTALGSIVLTEQANRDVGTGSIVLNAPPGFQFNPAATVTMTVTRVAGSSTALTLGSATATVAADGTTITINVTAQDSTSGGTTRSSITWAGITVRPTAGTPLASGTITKASGGATITGITAGSTSFGTLTEVVGAIASYAVSASSPQGVGVPFNTSVTAKDHFNNTVTTDNSTVVTMTGTGSVQFDSNGDGTFGDNTKTLSSGTFTIRTKDSVAETITITATSAGSKTGTSGSVVISPLRTVWLYRKAITIDHTKVSANQSGFPVLINLASDAGLAAHARSDGFDLLFTSSDGTTVLSYEREKYTSATGELVAWVKVPTLSSAADTVLYLYYGNAAATDQQDASNVWDSNYKGVWHLKENPAGTAPQMKDSAGGADNGTTGSGFVAGDQQAAKIDGGLRFGGAATYDVSIANETNFDFERTNSFTIEYWSKPTSGQTGKQNPVSKLQNTSTFPGYEVGHNYGGTPSGGIPTNTAGGVRIVLVNKADGNASDRRQIVVYRPGTKLNDGAWHHYVWTYSGSGTAAGVKLYEDGTPLPLTTDSEGDTLGANSMLNNVPMHIGMRDTGPANWYNGLLDEVRISATARNAAWIQTGWTNQAAPSSFYSVGTEQAATTTTSISSSLNPSTYGESVTFTATVTSSGGTPTGTVTFLDGATTLGTGTLSSGQATFSLSSLSAGSHSITAQYGGDGTFGASTGTLSGGQTVNKATPVITWSNPADIVYGTALGSSQLNATTTVPGTFAYTPASGTVLGAGSSQPLSTTFTPTDTANYNGTSATMYINVVETPSVIGIVNNGDGSVTVTFAGTPGAEYLVLATTDLTSPGSWENVSTNTAGTDGQWTFTDSTAAHPLRFYRAAKP